MKTSKTINSRNESLAKSPFLSSIEDRICAIHKEQYEYERVLIDVVEVARILRKSKPTIYRWVKAGVIPCYKIGKNLFFYKDELLAFVGICRVFNTPN